MPNLEEKCMFHFMHLQFELGTVISLLHIFSAEDLKQG